MTRSCPIWKRCAGRRRRAVSHEEPLPPTAAKPMWLWGRELRAVCLALLRTAQGALSLRQLHVLLHRAGYAIAHRTPVKALADALGHEADVGRARRVARGCYAVHRPRRDHRRGCAERPAGLVI